MLQTQRSIIYLWWLSLYCCRSLYRTVVYYILPQKPEDLSSSRYTRTIRLLYKLYTQFTTDHCILYMQVYYTPPIHNTVQQYVRRRVHIVVYTNRRYVASSGIWFIIIMSYDFYSVTVILSLYSSSRQVFDTILYDCSVHYILSTCVRTCIFSRKSSVLYLDFTQ